MNKKQIEEMIGLMNKYGLSELEIEKDNVRLRLKKGPGGVVERMVEMPPTHIPMPLKAAAREEARKTVDIKAPMVGTFYNAPAPDAPSFVEAGDNINAGDVVCIIEAMKLMNEIKSEVKGKIVDILAENGEPVEFGQVLFLVEPT